MKVKGLNIGIPYINFDIDFDNTENQKAAWQLYIEISTRISTITLDSKGDEREALTSIYKLFEATRTTLKEFGPSSIEVARVAISVLNKVIRPFTTKWHNSLCVDKYGDFREELAILSNYLKNYKKTLADIANVDDFVD